MTTAKLEMKLVAPSGYECESTYGSVTPDQWGDVVRVLEGTLSSAQDAQPSQMPAGNPCLNDYVDKTIRAHMAKFEMRWLPIEGVPKDMASRLYLVNGFCVQGFVDVTGQLCAQNDRNAWQKMRGKPTHYMPLPPAPSAEHTSHKEEL